MSTILNNVVVAGRLGRDPESRYTPEGKTVANFSIAITDLRKKSDGGYENNPVWMDITAWERTAERVMAQALKGIEVIITGRLSNNSWEDKNGNRRSKVFITATTFQVVNGQKSENKNDDEEKEEDSSKLDKNNPSDEKPEEEDADLPF